MGIRIGSSLIFLLEHSILIGLLKEVFMKKAVRLTQLCGWLILVAMTAQAEIKNPDTFVLATYGTVRTLDPAVSYDATSSQRIWNLYETLVFFDGSKTDKFIRVMNRSRKSPTVPAPIK
jgi:ABC-type transport system substrate-binding protein